MSNQVTVFMDKVLNASKPDVIQAYLKTIAEIVKETTKVDVVVQLSNNELGRPRIAINIYDVGNITGWQAEILKLNLKARTIYYFGKHGFVLKPSDITVPIIVSLAG